MKFSLTLGFATSASLLALSSPSAAATVKAPSPQTCGDRSHAVPFYFSELPGQAVYYTTLTSDVELLVTPLGYTFRGVAALVFTTQEPSTVPFYHVRNIQAVDNLYTTSVIERDTAVENGDIDGPIAAYIYPSQICGSVPFYRLYSNAATEHYYTINATDQAARVASGVWADEGLRDMCWILICVLEAGCSSGRNGCDRMRLLWEEETAPSQNSDSRYRT